MKTISNSVLGRIFLSVITLVFVQLVVLEVVYGLISLSAPDSRFFELLPLDQVGFMHILVFAGKINFVNLIFVAVWTILLMLIMYFRLSRADVFSKTSLISPRILWPIVGVLAIIQLPISQSLTPLLAAGCCVAVARFIPLPSSFKSS